MAPAPFINPALADLARREDTLIVFPHTQRTGGKTLRDAVLCAVYGEGRVYSASLGTGPKAWKDVTKADLDGFRVYTGPSNFADLDKGRPTVFVGLVRHPLYRAISLYRYCRKRATHPLHELAQRCSLEQFFPEAMRANAPYFCNTQCLRLCGSPNAHRAQQTILQKYAGIGFTADIGAFATALGTELGWPRIVLSSLPAEEERYDRQVSAKLREIVLAENKEDLKIYDWMAAGQFELERRRGIFSHFRRGREPGIIQR